MSSENEVLWLVDEQDRELGSCRRGDAHRLGLRHRSVHVLVFRPDGRLYLQRRSATKDVNPGLWDTSSAGHVDFGETYEVCALRELAEELGISRQFLQFLFKIPASARTGWEFVQVYRCDFGGEIVPNPDEIAEGQWFSVEEVDGMLAIRGEAFTESFREIWFRVRGML